MFKGENFYDFFFFFDFFDSCHSVLWWTEQGRNWKYDQKGGAVRGGGQETQGRHWGRQSGRGHGPRHGSENRGIQGPTSGGRGIPSRVFFEKFPKGSMFLRIGRTVLTFCVCYDRLRSSENKLRPCEKSSLTRTMRRRRISRPSPIRCSRRPWNSLKWPTRRYVGNFFSFFNLLYCISPFCSKKKGIFLWRLEWISKWNLVKFHEKNENVQSINQSINRSFWADLWGLMKIDFSQSINRSIWFGLWGLMKIDFNQSINRSFWFVGLMRSDFNRSINRSFWADLWGLMKIDFSQSINRSIWFGLWGLMKIDFNQSINRSFWFVGLMRSDFNRSINRSIDLIFFLIVGRKKTTF